MEKAKHFGKVQKKTGGWGKTNSFSFWTG